MSHTKVARNAFINSAGFPKTSCHKSLWTAYSWQHLTSAQTEHPRCFRSHRPNNQSTKSSKSLVVPQTAALWECEAMTHTQKKKKYQWDVSRPLVTQRNHWLCNVTVGDGLGNGGGTVMKTGWEVSSWISPSSFEGEGFGALVLNFIWLKKHYSLKCV